MLIIGGTLIEPGDVREVHFPITEDANSRPVLVPITVIRGLEDGPKLLLTAAVHGDELNGTAILRELITRVRPRRLKGTLIVVPIANMISFLLRSRYLPDHRDLNRFFPGMPGGNMAQRMAHRLFEDVVRFADLAVDLHTAATSRENFPHIRGDLRNPEVRRLARAFGPAVIIDHPGRKGTLRRVATEKGIPTIVFEGGTGNKFQRPVVREGLLGIERLLAGIGMLRQRKEGRGQKPPFQIIVRSTQWIRAEHGGILELKTHPGSLLHRGDPVATVSNPLGRDIHVIPSPITGLVIGATTIPIANPGIPIVHIVELKKTLGTVERAIASGRFRIPRIY